MLQHSWPPIACKNDNAVRKHLTAAAVIATQRGSSVPGIDCNHASQTQLLRRTSPGQRGRLLDGPSYSILGGANPAVALGLS